MNDKKTCPHNVLRRLRSDPPFAETVYVCGSCANLYTTLRYVEPKPEKPEPMSKTPWGLRDRQA